MLIFRYLSREVFITLIALTGILLLIFMSNQFVQYLNRAAAGSIPGMVIIKLMMLELPNLIGLLVPLGFYVALLIAYGRLYAENEMTVLQACGYSSSQLYRHTFILAGIVYLFVTLVMIWFSPLIATERAKLLKASGLQTLMQTIIPGRFQKIPRREEVFYVESMTRDHSKANHVFLARHTYKEKKDLWEIVWAQRAFLETNTNTGEDYIVLQKGHEYQGLPGHADYQVAHFDQYKAHIPRVKAAIHQDIRTASTASLFPFNNPDLSKAAELQWRFSVPFMVLVLTFLALPLSRVSPRSGKYAKLLPAILIYIIYANFMFVSRNWVTSGKVPLWVGMIGLHALFTVLGLILMWRNRLKSYSS